MNFVNWAQAASLRQRRRNYELGTSYKLAPTVNRYELQARTSGCRYELQARTSEVSRYELQARTSGEWVRAASSHQRWIGTSCKLAPAVVNGYELQARTSGG